MTVLNLYTVTALYSLFQYVNRLGQFNTINQVYCIGVRHVFDSVEIGICPKMM